jgi:hypothetical protein
VQQQSTRSWFTQFWPWFLIAFPLTAVIAGLYTVFIAFDNQDSMVKGDYYKQGLAINEQLREQRLAEEMGLTATAHFNLEQQQVSLSLASKQNVTLPSTLQIHMIHQVDDQYDFAIALVKVAEGLYQGSYIQQLQHRWRLQLNPLNSSADQNWKMLANIEFSKSLSTAFSTAL